ncbi:MAG: hypothetical protein Q3972_06905 [Corynebacterium sp.]|nr:hypothetical protein [Corynebacterium sp.]
MRIVRLWCDNTPAPDEQWQVLGSTPPRSALKELKAMALDCLGPDTTPTLAEMAADPNLPHLGMPAPAPQHPQVPLRLIIAGTNAGINNVMSYLMRQDILWPEFGIIPHEPGFIVTYLAALGVTARTPEEFSDPELTATPKVCLRDDNGRIILGGLRITDWDGAPMTGEVIVDSESLFINGAENQAAKPRRFSFFKNFSRGPRYMGAICVPSTDHPEGLSATAMIDPSPENPRVYTGRALQVGGRNLRIEVDNISRERPVEKATIYRHLRDLQLLIV